MIRRLFFFLLLFTCVSWKTQASIDVHSTFITINDGLANNTIRYIYQDSKGFIWISTLNGLSRYNGYSFTTFLPEKGRNISINYHHVHKVNEDKNGLLWITFASNSHSCYDLKQECFVDYTGCGEYLQEYAHQLETSNGNNWFWDSQNGCRQVIYSQGEFTSVVYRKGNGKLPSDQVNYLVEDQQNTIWICTQSGLVQVKGNSARIIGKEHSFVAAMPYKKDCFFLTQHGDIYRYDQENELVFITRLNTENIPLHLNTHLRVGNDWVIYTKERSYVFNLSDQKTIIDKSLQIANGRFVEDNLGNFYIYNGTGKLHYLNKKDRTLKTFQLISPEKITPASGEQYKVVQDKHGLIWITVFGNGLFVYNPLNDEMTHFAHQEEGRNRVCSNFLNRIFIDKSDNFWIGSEYSGVTRLSVVNNGASYIYPEDKNLTDHSNAIRMLEPLSNGNIWVGTRQGKVYIYDQLLQPQIVEKAPYSHIYAVAEDCQGKLWLGSRGKGVCIDGRWYVHNEQDPQSVSFDHIFDIYRDNKDRMWIGTFGGGLDLAVPQKNGYAFRHFLTGINRQQEIRIITQDNNGWMWVGTNYGICVFNPDSIIADPQDYVVYNFDNDKLPGNEIKCIFRDSKGRIWMGMLGKGFCICTPGNDYTELQFAHYTSSNGLVNNMVESIQEDKEGNYWIATENGISRFDIHTTTFENFFFSTSMQENIFTHGLVTNRDSLLFGTNHGLVVVDPKRVISNATFAHVVFTDLKVNGVSVHPNDQESPLNEALYYTDILQLKHYQNSFVIEFSTLDYSITNKAKYTHKLDNFDEEWSTPSPLNFAAYKNLSPGTYLLHVKACNSAGIWSEKEAIIQIVIAPPFWKLAWAYIIYVLIGGILLAIAFRLIRNFNALRNRIQIEKQLTEYKLMFFTNVSHEFRTPLTLIQGALEKIKRVENAPQEMIYPIRLMSKSTDRMLRLINQLLEFRKMQNNKLALMLEETDVISFFREIFLNLEETAKDKNFDFRFVSSVESYKMFIDRGKLDKIIYNLLSNAFKYTPNDGTIVCMVSVEEDNNCFAFSVSDTGIGIPKEKQRELFSRFMQSSFSHDSVGVGLHLTYELVNVHKGSISYRENEGRGSVFTVTLPLDTSLYEEKDYLIPNSLLEEPLRNELLEEGNRPGKDALLTLSGEKKKILIIEDDNDVCKFLETELDRYFEILTATDGLSGLKSAQTFDGDLIICDVLMPGMNGFDVTRQLKGNFSTSHIPVILLTAMSTPEHQLEGTESGADAYITKPFSPTLLLARINQLICQREKLRDKFSNDPMMANPALSSSELDKKFANRIQSIMEKQLANADFTIEDFATALGLGRTVFFRKVKGVTGYTPNEYMRIVRLKKAVELLQEGRFNVSEITYQVGMKDPLYFSRCFKEQFGVAPSAFLRGVKSNDTSP